MAACKSIVSRSLGKGTLCNGPTALPVSLLPTIPPCQSHSWVVALEGQTLHTCFRHRQRQHLVARSPEETGIDATRCPGAARLVQPCPKLRITTTPTSTTAQFKCGERVKRKRGARGHENENDQRQHNTARHGKATYPTPQYCSQHLYALLGKRCIHLEDPRTPAQHSVQY